MTRRSKASGKSGKARGRKAAAKRSTAPNRSSAVDQKNEIARLRRELQQALEQQTSTSEVLKVISRSTFDLKPVLESLLEKAIRLCDADRGLIYRQDGEVYRAAASYGHTAEFIKKVVDQNPIRQDRSSATGRAVLERRVVHIHDILADPEYRWAQEHRGDEGMHRTLLAVPMLREDTIIGVITIRRVRVQPFTDKQVELVQSFAAQAVIAIENTRLLSELREALDQQTATADVLSVISSSPGELAPVFQAMLENAVRICEAKFGNMYLVEGDGFRLAAPYNTPPALLEERADKTLRPGPNTMFGEVTRRSKLFMSTTLSSGEGTSNAILYRFVHFSWAVCEPYSWFRCLRTTTLSESLASTVKKSGRSLISRSRCCKTLPRKPSSPSRMRGF
jgi:hypothetical protein